MNSSSGFAVKDCALGSGHHTKPKKRRHRNKLRNPSLRKKRTKKFYPVKKTNSFKPNGPNFNPDSEKIMSNWYWSNYKKAVEWQDRHKMAHWKARALALLEENRYLLQIINDMRPGTVPNTSVTQSNLGEHSNFSRNTLNSGRFTNFSFPGNGGHNNDGDSDGDEEEGNNEGDENVGDEDEDDIEFEMSEEMMQFFEQSYRHKMDLKKLKDKELLNKAEEEIKQMQTNKIRRSTEMNVLYGDGASMITGMETAVQLSFDKYCDTKSPKYWPNIPFRL